MYALCSIWLCHLRFVLTLFLSLCASVYLITSAIASFNFRRYQEDYDTIAHLQPGDDGYNLHVISNSSEWLSFLFIMSLTLTFFDEFQQVIMMIDCQEKSPTIISYDGIGEYDEMKLNFYDDDDDENNN